MHPHHKRHHRNAKRLGLAFWLNVILAGLWTVMLPVTLLTGLKASVPFVAAISIYALMASHVVGAIASMAGQASNENAMRLPTEAPSEETK